MKILHRKDKLLQNYYTAVVLLYQTLLPDYLTFLLI